MLLTLLGVPHETVMFDYMLSNTYLRQKNTALLAAFPPDLAKAMAPLMGVKEEYLQAGFDEVQATYGSFEAYIRDGIGLSDETIAGAQGKFPDAVKNARCLHRRIGAVAHQLGQRDHIVQRRRRQLA